MMIKSKKTGISSLFLAKLKGNLIYLQLFRLKLIWGCYVN